MWKKTVSHHVSLYSLILLVKCEVKLLSHVQLFATPRTVAHQVPLSLELVLQARTLQWVAMPFSRGSFQPRDRTRVSPTARQILYLLSPQRHVKKGTEERTLTEHWLGPLLASVLGYVRSAFYIYLLDSFWLIWFPVELEISCSSCPLGKEE